MPRVIHPIHWRIILRLSVTGAAVLVLSHWLLAPAAQLAMTALEGVLPMLERRFVYLDFGIDGAQGQEKMSVLANLRHVVVVDSKRIVPFGVGEVPEGYASVSMTVGGAMQPALVVLIVLLSWPASRRIEWAWRALLGIAAAAALVLANVSITLLAEFWSGFYAMADENLIPAILPWSRFLMGGGAIAVSLAAGWFVIEAARRLSRLAFAHMPPATHRHPP